jgi:hypothetical protein
MMAKLKFVAPLVMAGAAATAIAAAPIAAAESFATSPGGDGCYNGICGSGDAGGGSGCTTDGTCGSGGPLGGGGCTAEGVCGHGGPWGGGGCVPGVGCFNWGQ